MRTILVMAAMLWTNVVCCGGEDTNKPANHLVIHADQGKNVINKNIYGQFAEHLGRCIYDGIWVGQDSNIPNINGIRKDVVDALKKIQVPFVRWPGGCFAELYHWRYGVGPVSERPSLGNINGEIETNQFGTHEFMQFCELIDTEPMLCANVGNGTPQELYDWFSYMTRDDTTLAAERRKNGRIKPWKVGLLCVGNENCGCGGMMTAETYANKYRTYQYFGTLIGGSQIFRIASGPIWDDYAWTENVMKTAAAFMDGLSFHYYSVNPFNVQGGFKGNKSAIKFDESTWHETMYQSLRIEELMLKHLAVMEKYDPEKKVALMVDEWGTWYEAEPNSSGCYQENTIRDAVVAGATLNIFNNHCDRVKGAAIAQIVNVLQAMILTKKDKMLLTPTYHVFDMYKVHQNATMLPTSLEVGKYEMSKQSIPAMNVSASKDKNGVIHVSVCNFKPNEDIELKIDINGQKVRTVKSTILTAPEMNSRNTFDAPNSVVPISVADVPVTDGGLKVKIPAKSVVMFEIK